MAEGRSIPVRLSPEVIERLDAVAKRTGMTRNGLMKFCVSTFAYEMEDGVLNTETIRAWRDVLKNLDGRTHRYTPKGREPAIKVAEKKGRYKKESGPAPAPRRKRSGGK